MPRIIKSAKGTFTSATVTVDSSGRVVAGESGAGGAVMTPKITAFGPSSGTYTSNGNQMMAYAASGGGGGGGGPQQQGPNSIRGGAGGFGVVGVFTSDITPPFSQPYAVGGLGSSGSRGPANTAQNGSAGGATSIATLFSLNGGNGGNKAPETTNGNPGTPGTIGTGSFVGSAPTPNADNGIAGNPGPEVGGPTDMAYYRQTIMFGTNAGLGGTGGNRSQTPTPSHSPNPGGMGALIVFDNA